MPINQVDNVWIL